ncbi:UNVERIFIED_ORG: hypothetical protein GGD51_005566 [Rhizobium esperanzae]|nr:hypothetical protein CO650_27500 [Rhizobium phaseoli]PWI55227.1 hypothetical protein B5K03_04805 [Rhizobium phaseoli]
MACHEAGERACRAATAHRREVGRRQAQRSALILRCPAGASKGEGGWLDCDGIGKVASPVLRGSALRGYAPQDEAGERARHEAAERAAGTAINPTRSARTLIGPHPGRHPQTISPHPEVPRRGLEGRGRVASVASPVLRGFALRAAHLRMRLERGRAMRLERGEQAQRSALILRCPAGASKDEGGWLRWPAPSFEASPSGLRTSG